MIEELSGATTMAAADQVPHPLHAYVSSLLTRIRTVQGRLHNKQLRPATAVSAGTAWVSSAATLWAQEFTPRTATYVARVRSLDDDLAELLRRTPSTCTSEEAARWRAKLGGHYGA
jgi:hypothetical protein